MNMASHSLLPIDFSLTALIGMHADTLRRKRSPRVFSSLSAETKQWVTYLNHVHFLNARAAKAAKEGASPLRRRRIEFMTARLSKILEQETTAHYETTFPLSEEAHKIIPQIRRANRFLRGAYIGLSLSGMLSTFGTGAYLFFNIANRSMTYGPMAFVGMSWVTAFCLARRNERKARLDHVKAAAKEHTYPGIAIHGRLPVEFAHACAREILNHAKNGTLPGPYRTCTFYACCGVRANISGFKRVVSPETGRLEILAVS